ncbi:MAG: tRNA preQ1(34) S-adenosylmethionine ribosyltransferase-isomerase QueA [Pseudomonadota bacterium]
MLSDYYFELPEELIALRPVSPRRSAKLLIAGPEPDPIQDRSVEDLPRALRPGDLLVFNDAKVIPARLAGERLRADGKAQVEATLIERVDPGRWRALARPGKRLAVGDLIRFAAPLGASALTARIEAKGEGGLVTLAFDRVGPDLDVAVGEIGSMPLPPYIASRRAPDARDHRDYQTLFARAEGAVAAPTAALHFDDVLMRALAAAGVRTTTVTLFVGAGTFLPVKVERVDEHKMHSERGMISAEAAEAVAQTRAAGGRVIAVGTTALRLLESAARDAGAVSAWSGSTDLFIRPGFEFRAADGLMTNFHLPKSTLLMLVAAFVGLARMRAIYAHAVREKYRFFSYGDSSLLWRAPPES